MHARLERTVLPDSVVPTASTQALYSARIGKHFYELTIHQTKRSKINTLMPFKETQTSGTKHLITLLVSLTRLINL